MHLQYRQFAARAFVLVWGLGWALYAQAEDRSITLGEPGWQELEMLTGEGRGGLQMTGFGVGDYHYAGRTNDNSFRTGKLALALFREVSDRAWIFGQLTTALSEESAGAEVATETEIDNLLLNAVLPGHTGISLAFGKFDVPLGFERDDEPLNLQATRSFNSELGRPLKLVGFMGRWNLSARLELSAMLANGWDTDVDPNQGKTAGLRVGFTPTENLDLGLGALFGSEGERGDARHRYLLSLDYALQPGERWIFAGEANLGGDRNRRAGGGDARWFGATLTLFHLFTRRLGVVARAEVFDDRDGARTGLEQRLESYAVAPILIFGSGREGIFSTVEHTRFHIPRVQIRAETRFNHSDRTFFEGSSGAEKWDLQYRAQIASVF